MSSPATVVPRPSKALQERFSRRLEWAELDPAWLRQHIDAAKAEDLEGAGLAIPPRWRGDVSTALLPRNLQGHAALVARKPMTVAGLPLVPLVLQAYAGADEAGPVQFTPQVADGTAAAAGQVLGTLHGPVAPLLMAERVILNYLQRLSGVATQTAKYVAALRDSPTRLLDTRKTTPGWRVLEKYAVGCGGGWNHRLGLYDRIMLKDNHWAALGQSKAHAPDWLARVRQARQQYPGIVVEIEVDVPEQIPAALAARPEILLLDNFSPEKARQEINTIDGGVAIELSGNLTLENLPQWGGLGAEFLSSGALTHQATWIDVGLDWLS